MLSPHPPHEPSSAACWIQPPPSLGCCRHPLPATAPLSHCASSGRGPQRPHDVCAAGGGSSRRPSQDPGACCTHHPRRRWGARPGQALLGERTTMAPAHSSFSTWCVGSGTTPGRKGVGCWQSGMPGTKRCLLAKVASFLWAALLCRVVSQAGIQLVRLFCVTAAAHQQELHQVNVSLFHS